MKTTNNTNTPKEVDTGEHKLNSDDIYNEICFTESFNTIAKRVARINKQKGWEENWNDAEQIALMHTELSETLESLRIGDPPSKHIPDFKGSEEELADEIIRIMHYAQHNKLNIAGALIAKLEYNANRSYKHGGKKF